MKIKDILLGIAIIVLTIFVTFYGINTIYPKPNYEDFCKNTYATKIPSDRSICPAVCIPAYEIVRDRCVYNECGSGCGPDEINSFSSQSTCEDALYEMKCWERHDQAVRERSKKVFFVALPLGLIVIALGAFAFGLEAVGSGLIGGGIGTLIYGSGAYWPYSQNWIRFLISLVGLVILIWLIYYFNKRMGKNKGKKR